MNFSIVETVLQEGMREYDRGLAKIVQCLPSYETYCKDKILELAQCKNFHEADKIFDDLLNIQNVLSQLLFVRLIPLGDRLEILTKLFERLDDQTERLYWFERFQAGLEWPAT